MNMVAVGAGLALATSIGMLAAFFATRNERFDRIAEWAFVALAILGVPTMLILGDRLAAGGLAAPVLTWIGIAGVVVVGAGELAATLRIVDFRKISPIVALGFLAFLVWVGGSAAVSITTGRLPAVHGWLGVGSIVVAIALMGVLLRTPGVMSGAAEPSRAMMGAFFVPIIGVVAWLVWLGPILG
jgi:hypothetical protein